MTGTTSCPAPDVLDRLRAGHLPAAVADAVRRHQAGCPACGGAEAETGVVPVQPPPTPPPAPAGLRLQRRSQAVSTSALRRAAAEHGAPPPPRPAGLLNPPEGPGEIGRLGGYRVVRVLGEGGMGLIYEAEDPDLGRPVALKVLRPEQAGDERATLRFLQEARAAAAIVHDHIVTVYQVGEDNGVLFLAMQLLNGESLADRLRREGRLPVGEVVRIAREAAEGLAAAHARGLVHRDVKPANIFLEKVPGRPGGRVKILDFGLARPAGPDAAGGLTQAGMVVGTPGYMAPEQARGLPLDARCDLFALGCVAHKMATGQDPFRGDTPLNVVVSLTVDEVPALSAVRPEVPAALSDLVGRLLAKDAAARPGSADAVAEALAGVEARPVDLTPAPAANRPWPPPPAGLAATGVMEAQPPSPAAYPPAAPAPAAPAGNPVCAGCGEDLRGAGDKTWCVQCGYVSDEADDRARVPVPAAGQGFRVPVWPFALLVGMIAVVAATSYRDHFLPKGTLLVWWVLVEAGVGAGLYLIGNVAAVALSFRFFRDGGVFQYVDPMQVWRAAVTNHRRAGWAVAVAGWGVTAFAYAFGIFMVNDFAFKDKSKADKRNEVLAQLIRAAAGAGATEEGSPDDFLLLLEPQEPVPPPDDVNLIDLYGDDKPAADLPGPTAECVVIGYVPDPDNPDAIGELVLGVREEDGTIRYAGTVAHFAAADDVAAGLSQVRGLNPLLDRPGYLPAGLNAVPVEPTLACRVSYAERDAKGVLRDAVLRAVGPRPAAKPKDKDADPAAAPDPAKEKDNPAAAPPPK